MPMNPALAASNVQGWSPAALRRTRLADLPAIAGGASAAIGMIVLFGWTFNIAFLTTVVPRAVAMKPNTALGLVLMGVGLAVISGRVVGLRRRRIGVGLVLSAATIGLLTAMEYLTGRDLGIDQVLFSGFVADAGGLPGRMAPLTATCFCLLGAAAAGAAFGIGRRLIVGLAAAAIVIAGLNLFSFAFAATTPSFLAGYTAMAVHTALAICFLGLGILGLLGSGSPFAPLSGGSATAQLSRRLLAVCLVAPIVVAVLRLQGQTLGLYDTAFGTSLMLVGIMTIIAVAILRSARWASALEVGRERAEVERDRFFEMSLDMLVVMGSDGVFRRVNQAWVTTFGYLAAEVEGQPWTDFIHPDDLDRTVAEADRNLVQGEPSFAFSNRYRRSDGTYRWLEWMSQTSGGDVAFAVARDVTVRHDQDERRESQSRALEVSNENLTEQAARDPLTTLHNRRYFESAVERLEKTWSGLPVADRPPVAVIVFDLDRFGLVNKEHGHQTGDVVLRTFGGILRKRFRDRDLLVRYGGEEFVAVLEGATAADAVRIAESVRVTLEGTTLHSDAGPLRVTVSAGVAELGEQRDISDGLSQADVWLAQAKRGGRNQVVG